MEIDLECMFDMNLKLRLLVKEYKLGELNNRQFEKMFEEELQAVCQNQFDWRASQLVDRARERIVEAGGATERYMYKDYREMQEEDYREKRKKEHEEMMRNY